MVEGGHMGIYEGMVLRDAEYGDYIHVTRIGGGFVDFATDEQLAKGKGGGTWPVGLFERAVEDGEFVEVDWEEWYGVKLAEWMVELMEGSAA
jgi:hypothetical protein